jgi:hypothetical protein
VFEVEQFATTIKRADCESEAGIASHDSIVILAIDTWIISGHGTFGKQVINYILFARITPELRGKNGS